MTHAGAWEALERYTFCKEFHIWPPHRIEEAYEDDLQEFRVILQEQSAMEREN